MKIAIIDVKYTEFEENTYKSVRIVFEDQPDFEIATGDVVADFKAAVEACADYNIQFSSSVDDFVRDNDEYAFDDMMMIIKLSPEQRIANIELELAKIDAKIRIYTRERIGFIRKIKRIQRQAFCDKHGIQMGVPLKPNSTLFDYAGVMYGTGMWRIDLRPQIAETESVIIEELDMENERVHVTLKTQHMSFVVPVQIAKTLERVEVP